jgi:NAD(P)-dependent dehydrogenase (short-subunit alcohol dehydrogenase family)
MAILGINLAFVQELYMAGCSSLIVDVALHPTATEWLELLPKDSMPKVHFYQADVSDWRELEMCFDVYDQLVGGVPFLVCPGAGIYEPVCKHQ